MTTEPSSLPLEPPFKGGEGEVLSDCEVCYVWKHLGNIGSLLVKGEYFTNHKVIIHSSPMPLKPLSWCKGGLDMTCDMLICLLWRAILKTILDAFKRLQ